MKTYSISQEGLNKIRRRLTTTFTIVGILFVGFTLWRTSDQMGSIGFWIGGLPVLLVFLILYGFMAYRTIQQQQAVWKSVVVELGDDYVSRSQLRIPVVRVGRNEITHLQETTGALCIFTKDKHRMLAIPRDIQGYEDIKATLLTWASLKSQSLSTQVMGLGLIVVLIIGFAMIWLAPNLWLTLAAAIPMLGFYGYTYWSQRKQKGIDPQLKRAHIISIGFIIFITLIKLSVALIPMR
jgi:hypothetical protein